MPRVASPVDKQALHACNLRALSEHGGCMTEHWPTNRHNFTKLPEGTLGEQSKLSMPAIQLLGPDRKMAKA